MSAAMKTIGELVPPSVVGAAWNDYAKTMGGPFRTFEVVVRDANGVAILEGSGGLPYKEESSAWFETELPTILQYGDASESYIDRVSTVTALGRSSGAMSLDELHNWLMPRLHTKESDTGEQRKSPFACLTLLFDIEDVVAPPVPDPKIARRVEMQKRTRTYENGDIEIALNGRSRE